VSVLVIEIGAKDPRSVLEIIRYVFDGARSALLVVPSDSIVSELNYIEVAIDDAELLKRLVRGEISSAMLKCCDDSRYALINRPGFLGKLCHWYGQIEITGGREWKFIEELLLFDGIDFVSVSLEDTVDLDQHVTVTPENFPWNHWRLIEAAVKDGDAWDRRSGSVVGNE
jgi:hypothetical protein